MCRDFKALVDDTLSLQYKLECCLAGVCPQPSDTVDLPAALDRLRCRREASITLENTTKYTIGFMSFTEPETTPEVESVVSRGIVAQVKPDGDGKILFTQLPSESRGIRYKQWSVDIGMRLRWFEVDYGQDLVINIQPRSVMLSCVASPSCLINISFEYRRYHDRLRIAEWEVHAFSISDGGRHPQASKEPVVIIPGRTQHVDSMQLELRITDGHVGVILLSEFYAELWVLDWRTGDLKLVRTYFDKVKPSEFACEQNLWGSDAIEYPGMLTSSFVFIERQLVVVPTWTNVRTKSRARIALRVFDYDSKAPQRTRLEDAPSVATFELPELSRGAIVLHVEAAGCPYSAYGPPAALNAPFHCEPSPQLLAVSIYLEAGDNYGQSLALEYQLFMLSDTIAQRYGSAPQVLPWDRWCDEVRLVHIAAEHMVTDDHIFHTRCIFPVADYDAGYSPYDARQRDRARLVIYDFAPSAVLRYDSLSSRFANCAYVFEPSVVEQEHVWKAKTITSGSACPYRKIWTTIGVSFQDSTFSLTEDCIIVGDEEEYVMKCNIHDHK